eukprot:13472001-Alexandrium_andersonii.AAC.1
MAASGTTAAAPMPAAAWLRVTGPSPRWAIGACHAARSASVISRRMPRRDRPWSLCKGRGRRACEHWRL